MWASYGRWGGVVCLLGGCGGGGIVRLIGLGLRWLAGYLGLAVVFVWGSAQRGGGGGFCLGF